MSQQEPCPYQFTLPKLQHSITPPASLAGAPSSPSPPAGIPGTFQGPFGSLDLLWEASLQNPDPLPLPST